MFGSIRETLMSVQSELSSGVEKLRFNVAPSMSAQQRCVSEAVDDIVKTTAGSDLLLKFQMELEQMRVVGDEGARLANMCSTRMGRAQQMCKERADAVMNIDAFIRNFGEIEKKIKDLNKQIDKLTRFCNQTEQAMTHLEALDNIVKTEEEVNQIRQRSRASAAIIQIEPTVSAASIINGIATTSRPGDAAREKQEEVMLEEFLSSQKLEVP